MPYAKYSVVIDFGDITAMAGAAGVLLPDGMEPPCRPLPVHARGHP